ncbi:MAG: Activator of Hsp90 ATPase 1 family protein [Frankiales bacterium]|nr:Activator of Hsp90 ATPase 1 family protein [Frankiales bacterium]
MPIPNTITRTIELAHPQDKVWAAISTPEGITRWFGSHTTGEFTPGSDVVMRWEQYGNHENTLAVKVVEPMSVFAYTWRIGGAPDDDPRRTYVEFALEPTKHGTRLTVTESGFAQLPDEWLESTYQGNVAGWRTELDKLVAYLDAA